MTTTLPKNVAYAPTQKDGDCINIDLTTSTLQNNTFFGDITVTADDFESLDTKQLLLPRKADGSLPDITFLRLKPTSKAYEAKMGWEFPYDATDGIHSVVADAVYADDSYYNLQGVKVNPDASGIYIHKGHAIYIAR